MMNESDTPRRDLREDIFLDPWLSISHVKNGWILTIDDEHQVIEYDASMTGPENDMTLLSEIAYSLGVTGSRYDAQRISIGLKPGDKHHDAHPMLCANCTCRCDPDRSDASVAHNRTDMYGSTESTTFAGEDDHEGDAEPRQR